MNQSEMAQLTARLDDVMGLYNKPPLSERIMQLYLEALEPYKLEDIFAAIDRHIRGSRFAPNPGDIILQITGTEEDRGKLAWLEVCKAAERVGSYNCISFNDPAIHHAIVSLGGWRYVAEEAAGDIDSYMQQAFITAYRRGERIANWDNTPRWFPGQHFINNAGLSRDKWRPALYRSDGKRLPDAEAERLMVTNGVHNGNRPGILPEGGGLRGVADIGGIPRESGQRFAQGYLEGNGDAGRRRNLDAHEEGHESPADSNGV